MAAVALVTDLIFATKIKSTADQVGIPLSIVKDVQGIDDAAAAGVSIAILDLNAEVDGIEAVRRLKSPRTDGREQAAGAGATNAAAPPVVIAFASHVQSDLLQSARDAGADVVLPRSRFSAELPDLLARYGQMSDQR